MIDNKTPKIIFKDVDLDGRFHQENFFVLLDLIEKIFGESVEIDLNECVIHDFFFSASSTPRGSLRAKFADAILRINISRSNDKKDKRSN